jgi:hypothetical protein
MGTDPDKLADRQFQAILAEYNSLRTEIANRSRDQLVCVTGSLVTTGAVLSTVASDPASYTGLLVIAPWLLAVFGLLWCDHAHGIHFIAKYIREELEAKALPSLIGDRTFLRWEIYIHNQREDNKFLSFINVVLPLLYFALPALAIGGTYFVVKWRHGSELPPAMETSFIGMGAVLLVALGISWRRALRLS